MPSDEGCKCQRCDRIYKVDIMVSDDLWAEISRGRNMMCPICIAAAIEDRGHFDAFKLIR